MKTQLNTLTSEECDKLLDYLLSPQNNRATYRIHLRNYTMALCMLDAGLRVGELVKLEQKQFLYNGSIVSSLTIYKHQAKNKHERTVPISNRLQSALEKMDRRWWYADHKHETRYAFYATWCTRPLSVRQAQRIITGAGKTSLDRNIHPHLLRHTFATKLMTKTSIRVVQELLGHKQLSSTQIYTHPNSQDLRKAIDSLDQKK